MSSNDREKEIQDEIVKLRKEELNLKVSKFFNNLKEKEKEDEEEDEKGSRDLELTPKKKFKP